jgi:hypothetical protein
VVLKEKRFNEERFFEERFIEERGKINKSINQQLT